MPTSALEPIPIGMRRFGIDEDDYKYLLIVSESRICDILSLWDNADIIEYEHIPDIYMTLPIDAAYGIRGISDKKISNVLGIPIDVPYDILIILRPDIISDSLFILENSQIYSLIRMDEIFSSDPDMLQQIRYRLSKILIWAKSHKVYDGVYPDIFGYITFVINTIKKGYSLEASMKLLHMKILYFHNVYKYRYISYVSDRSFKHIQDIINHREIPYEYKYHIQSKHLSHVLRLTKKLFDIKGIQYIIGSTIYASNDISKELSEWKTWIRGYNLDID